MSSLAVIWRAADLLFATGVESVVEVLAPLAWSPTPAVPPWVRGLFSHRGRFVPLVDAAVLLGAQRRPDRMANRVLVVRCSSGPERIPWMTGLWVDCVVELEKLDFAAPGVHPGFATAGGRFLGPVAQTRWGPVQLVEPEQLFTAEQAAVLADRLKEAAA